MITKNQARKLAVRYQAYSAASIQFDPQGVVVWGGMLDEMQRETGVELMKCSHIKASIALARQKIDKNAD